MIRALIVDDERLARAELRRLLAAHSKQVEVVGEAGNAEEARRAVKTLAPGLLFLDVQMPGASGFDLLSSLDSVPDVIFTTAYDAYALKAFEVNALHYLQKPIEAHRLADAIERAAGRASARARVADASGERIFIRDGARCWFVSLPEIMLFESEGNYTRVYFGANRPLVLRSLNQLEERLRDRRFFRASRRQIVNLDCVESALASESGGLALRLSNGLLVEVSRRRAAELREQMSL